MRQSQPPAHRSATGAGLLLRLAGRIHHGETPADLPVQLSIKVELLINLKVAKTLGITIPTGLLLRADEVQRGLAPARTIVS
jgi:hypothetical protein